MNKQAWMLFLLVIWLAGCAGIPLSSAYKMMTANPLEFQPEGISIAIKRPNVLQVNTGDVKMGIGIHNKALSIDLKEEFFFVADNNANTPFTFVGQLNANQAFTVLKLSDDDAIRMQKLQQKMKKHLNNGGDKKDFSFFVNVLRGCKSSNEIPTKVLLSLYLRFDLKSDYFPLYEDFDIAAVDLSPLKNLKDWKHCPQSY